MASSTCSALMSLPALAALMFAAFLLQPPATQGQQQYAPPVSEICLGCICEAVSNCNQSLRCTGDVCGVFRITWPYWADAGKPVLAQDKPEDDGAYARCANEPYCAARAVQGYMAKYAQDCTGDGVVDCYDYAALHRLGGYGCRGNLDQAFQDKFSRCMVQVAQLNGGQVN